MKRVVELSVDPDYIQWTPEAAIRDLIANAIDGGTAGHEMNVEYRAAESTLVIANRGARVPLKALLLGYSTKRGNQQMIGTFGEGMKLAILSLIKDGMDVEVLNGTERWKPVLRHSETFDDKLLAFEIDSQEENTDFTVLIRGLSKEVWDKTQDQFLMFEAGACKAYETPYGRVLDGPRFAGRVYLKGVLIEHVTDDPFLYGYDLNPGQLTIDRDRKMASRSDLKCKAAHMWVYLAAQSDDRFDEMESLLRRNSPDVQDLKWAWSMTDALKRKLAKRFREHYGQKAIPVGSQDDVQRAAFVGAQGIVFGDSYVSLVQGVIGGLTRLEEEFEREVKVRFDTLDLDAAEEKTLFRAMNLVASAAKCDMPNIEIVEFQSEDIGGLCEIRNGEKTIYVARKILNDFSLVLITLMHEVAHHKFGMSHDIGFQDGLEKMWCALCVRLMNRAIDFASDPKRAISCTVSQSNKGLRSVDEGEMTNG